MGAAWAAWADEFCWRRGAFISPDAEEINRGQGRAGEFALSLRLLGWILKFKPIVAAQFELPNVCLAISFRNRDKLQTPGH